MDRTRTAVYMINILERLKNALEESERLMPGDIERAEENHYIGNSNFPALDLKNWVKRKTGIPVPLSPILDLLNDLEEQVENLKSYYQEKNELE